MEIFLDKDFVKEFPKGISTFDKELTEDYFRFLRRLRKIRIKTNLTWDEFEHELRRNKNIILANFINLNPQEFVFNAHLDLSIDPIREISAFSLLFAEDEDAVSYYNGWGFECICSRNFNNKWSIYSGSRPDRCMKVTNKSDIPDIIHFTSYNKIRNFRHPIHALIIFDLYILGDKDNQRMRDNLFPLLKNLLILPSKNQTIDLMIITKFNEFIPEDIKEKYDQINNFLNETFDDVRIHLSLIEYSKKHKPYDDASLKARRIYTNYLLVKSDDSFTYFRPGGKINNTTDIEFNFVFYSLNPEFVMSELKSIKSYVDKVPAKVPYAPNKHRVLFYPDKRNRLLSEFG